MSETTTRTRERPQMGDPFRDSLPANPEGAGSDMLPALTPRVGGQATDQAIANFVTAQRVAVKRTMAQVLTEVKALGQAAGPDFYYRIPFKDRRGGEEKTTWVEGPSIDCAMAVAACYGNCWVGATVAQEDAVSWTFSARFVDLEKGVTVVREFRQRKAQNTGMRDGGRQTDIVFQIGQSKAIRNVVCAAIPTPVNVAYEAAMNSVLARVEQAPDKFRDWLSDTIDRMRLDIRAIERALATKLADWTPGQMARTYADLKAVKDGMVGADELWPGSGGGAPETVSETAAGEAATSGAAEEKPKAPEPAKPPLPPKPRQRQSPPPPKEEPPPPPKQVEDPPPLAEEPEGPGEPEDEAEDRLPMPPRDGAPKLDFG